LPTIVAMVPPRIEDRDLVFDEHETRQILRFFWPNLLPEIAAVSVNNNVRRYSQGLLISAIDASYAMGYLQAMFESLSRPHKGLKAMGKKLAQRFVQHWWRHAQQKDLNDVKIYETVRRTIARSFASDVRLLLGENTLAFLRLPPFHVAWEKSLEVWT
jgi:trehalose utilization protein